MNIKDYIKQNLKLKIESSYLGYEVSILIENETIDTVVIPVVEYESGEEYDN